MNFVIICASERTIYTAAVYVYIIYTKLFCCGSHSSRSYGISHRSIGCCFNISAIYDNLRIRLTLHTAYGCSVSSCTCIYDTAVYFYCTSADITRCSYTSAYSCTFHSSASINSTAVYYNLTMYLIFICTDSRCLCSTCYIKNTITVNSQNRIIRLYTICCHINTCLTAFFSNNGICAVYVQINNCTGFNYNRRTCCRRHRYIFNRQIRLYTCFYRHNICNINRTDIICTVCINCHITVL